MSIIRSIGPSLVILENVSGLLSSNRGLDFATVIREMGEGWDCAEVGWRILDSQYFGVPQRRRRLFLVAGTRVGCAESVLALSESVSWHPAPRGEARKDRTAHPRDGTSEPVAVFRKSKRAQTAQDHETWVDAGVANTLNAFDVGEARTTHAVAVDVYNHKVDGDITATVTTSTGQVGGIGPMVISPTTSVRRLTPTECERLQGFPDGWTDGQPDTARYKQLGNAVTVNVAEWIARRCAATLNNGGAE
jgi:DNA (cytosine-5)-methyltransferase 1